MCVGMKTKYDFDGVIVDSCSLSLRSIDVSQNALLVFRSVLSVGSRGIESRKL